MRAEATPPGADAPGAALGRETTVAKAAPAKKKVKPWVWALVSVGVIAVAGGVTVGVLLGTRSSSDPSGGSLGLVDGRSR